MYTPFEFGGGGMMSPPPHIIIGGGGQTTSYPPFALYIVGQSGILYN